MEFYTFLILKPDKFIKFRNKTLNLKQNICFPKNRVEKQTDIFEMFFSSNLAKIVYIFNSLTSEGFTFKS